MLSHSTLRRCLARLAAASAAEYAEASRTDAPDAQDVPLWFDDTVAAREADAAHRASPEYKELHRPAMTTSAMGLFGGEPGFEKAYRVWVDPDHPQMKHVYNQTALAKNLRYTRYGYFKRDMHLLDVDKLVRHARMLPTPNRLLTDFLYQRVPLSDHNSAAFLRYQREQLEMLDDWQRPSSFHCAEELFERMIVTNIPPVEVGVETHAEMILCCAVCKEWEKGWSVYRQRALELEQDEPENMTLNTHFFDAVLQLCVACGRPQEGLSVMRDVIQRHLRPPITMLEKTMILASMGVEKLLHEGPDGRTPALFHNEIESATQTGLDAWSLCDFYQLSRTTTTIAAYVRLCGVCEKPALALDALSLADASGLHLSLDCFYWVLFAIRAVPDLGEYVMDMFSQLSRRGLAPDYILLTMAFLYCAKQQDGELALALYQQHYAHDDINPTPEMVLLALQAFSTCSEPRVEMLSCAEQWMNRLEEIGSVVDRTDEIYDQYIELAAHLGAVSSAFSHIKRLVSFGKPLTTRQMNSLLLANANADPPNGSLRMTLDIVNIFRLLRIAPNDDTIICLEQCLDAFGDTPEVRGWLDTLRAQQEASPQRSLGEDADVVVTEVAPHALRRLSTEWKLRARDTILRRFGQHTKPRPEVQVGSMLGSVIPFGRSPGEQSV